MLSGLYRINLQKVVHHNICIREHVDDLDTFLYIINFVINFR